MDVNSLVSRDAEMKQKTLSNGHDENSAIQQTTQQPDSSEAHNPGHPQATETAVQSGIPIGTSSTSSSGFSSPNVPFRPLPARGHSISINDMLTSDSPVGVPRTPQQACKSSSTTPLSVPTSSNNKSGRSGPIGIDALTNDDDIDIHSHVRSPSVFKRPSFSSQKSPSLQSASMTEHISSESLDIRAPQPEESNNENLQAAGPQHPEEPTGEQELTSNEPIVDTKEDTAKKPEEKPEIHSEKQPATNGKDKVVNTGSSGKNSPALESPVVTKNDKSLVGKEISNEEQKKPADQTGKSGSRRSSQTGRKNKPRRYKKPPIWAQEWVPPSLRRNNTNETNNAISMKSGLMPSIMGFVPHEDLTRQVTGWVYANLREVPPEHRKTAELEVKIGLIKERESGLRCRLPVMTETVLAPTCLRDYSFESQVPDFRIFKGIDAFLNRKLLEEKDRRNRSGDHGSMRKEWYTHVDEVFTIAERNEPIREVRRTKDIETGRIVACIEKQRIGSLLIYNPMAGFDYRLSLSVEIPVNLAKIGLEGDKQKPISRREKRRTSYIHPGTASRFDLTKVLQGVQRRSDNRLHEIFNHEVEIELDNQPLVKAFEESEQGVPDAPNLFEEIIKVLLDNTRTLIREADKLAF